MAQSVKIDDHLIELLRQDAVRQNRSIAAQAEHYIRLGRAIDRSPDFDQDHVDLALAGGLEVGELTLEEQEKFFEEFALLMEKPGRTADFFADRRARGLGVGETEDGQLIRQTPAGGVAPYSI